MDYNSYAVLIGINKYKDNKLSPLQYAEKDCQDLYNILTDPKICNFPEKNIKKLIGVEAKTRNVERALHTYCYKNRTENDIVLVYFSGHSFIAGDEQIAYIGTYDVNIKNLLQNPNEGIRMDRIHQDCFNKSKAKHVIFILDCCHSGAFTPSNKKSYPGSNSKDLLNPIFFSTGMGRIAICSCPPDSDSRKSKYHQNSLFTHYLIKALRGEASEQDTGEVTLDSLISYLNNKLPANQTPVRFGQSSGRIVISRPESINEEEPISYIQGDVQLNNQIDFKSLKNPLEPFVVFNKKLCEILKDYNKSTKICLETHILTAIRKASEADLIYVLRRDKVSGNYIIKSKSIVSPISVKEKNILMDQINIKVKHIISNILLKKPYDPDRFYIYNDDTGKSKAFVIIPLHLDLEKVSEFMVICGLKIDSPLLEDVYLKILTALYFATHELTYIDNAVIEDSVIDCIKEHYGYVSLNTYNNRFDSFCERLQHMDIFFEPILYTEYGKVHICGWEALARDPSNMKVPNELFMSAELWGDKFITELDLYFLRIATKKYMEALTKAKLQRPHEIQDLSINVYPQSLMRTIYFKTVDEVLKEYALIPEKFYLEISEKAPIPKEAGNIDVFKQRLEKYVRELRIGFSIDDFGVGHASIARLVKLNPIHIKIDKEVLNIHGNDNIIRFVIEVSRQDRLHAPKVILEGFDRNSGPALNYLYELGIRYIQGFIVGQAGSDLYRLKKEAVQDFENLLNAGKK